jgi:hypothetical protein
MVLAGCLAGCPSGVRVDGLEPRQGTYGGGEDVMIKGSGFRPGRATYSVYFGKQPAPNVVVESGSVIKVTTPAGKVGKVDVELTLEDGRIFRIPGGFQYVDASVDRNLLESFGQKPPR